VYDFTGGETSIVIKPISVNLVIGQILTDVPPFGVKTKGPKIIQLVAGGIKPQRSDHPMIEQYSCREELWSLFEECWDTDPVGRPSADDVVKRLKPMLHELAKKSETTEQRPRPQPSPKGPVLEELGRADVPVKSGHAPPASTSVPEQSELGKATKPVVKGEAPAGPRVQGHELGKASPSVVGPPSEPKQ
jgi:hypothetical protein